MIVETHNLSKNYGATPALKNVNLSIAAGDVVGILGPNGAGKTTLLECFEGLRIPSSGSVSVLGLNPATQSSLLNERIGVQLQSTSVPESLTPIETLNLFAALYKKSVNPVSVLARLGLSDKIKSRNNTLSGGQRQRLTIAMALINDPELIILDEPTSGLDAVARREIQSYVVDLRASQKTMLLSTHYIEEAEKLCDRVIVLRAGEVVADGSPSQLIAQAQVGGVSLSLVLAGKFDPEPLLQNGATCEVVNGDKYRFTATEPTPVLRALGEVLHSSEATVVEVEMKRPTLEDVYVSLMGSVPEPMRDPKSTGEEEKNA